MFSVGKFWSIAVKYYAKFIRIAFRSGSVIEALVLCFRIF